MIYPIFKMLNVPSIQAFVGTNPTRIFNFTASFESSQADTYPRILWLLVSNQPYDVFNEDPNGDFWVFQIDCVARTIQECEALAQAVQERFNQLGHTYRLIIHEQDTQTHLYRMAFEVNILNTN